MEEKKGSCGCQVENGCREKEEGKKMGKRERERKIKERKKKTKEEKRGEVWLRVGEVGGEKKKKEGK